MFFTSCIELSQSALRRNLAFLQKQVGSGIRFSSVIKGNAYGHGIGTFLPMAENCGVRHFSVFSAEEALAALQSRTCNSDIMIMGAIDNGAIEWAVENDISFYVFELDRLNAAYRAALKLKKPARIHLELETGLNRFGLGMDELLKAVTIIKKDPGSFILEGVCSHLAGAESISNYLRIQRQLQIYHKAVEWLKTQQVTPAYRHIACSAAALTYPETRLDMIRIGIAQYGFWPSRETRMDYYMNNLATMKTKMIDPMRRVMCWKSSIMSIKTVDPGEFIGYGNSYQTTRTQQIATVPIGYFHGFTRSLSNLGHVLVHGRRCEVVGNVNMNVIMIDATGLKDIQKGDEVVLIGKQRKRSISVASFSDLTRFLNYEVLVRLPSEIPRVVVD